MFVIPAIDLRGGKCVRLLRGDYQKETVYSDDPAAMAVRWRGFGADLLHVVDLDGAKAGHPVNLEAVRAICAAFGAKCELGGGIRTIADIEAAFSAGVARVILGTAACENADFVKEAVRRFGAERVVVGIDARDGKAAVSGWLVDSGIDALGLAAAMADIGVVRFIYTDIATDGALSGPNLPAMAALCAKVPACRVIASGGVSSAADIQGLKDLAARRSNLEGVIVGKALYDGKLDPALLWRNGSVGDIERLDKNMAAGKVGQSGLTWRHAWEPPFRLLGFPWFAKDRKYRRLPVEPSEKIPDAVNSLANCCAGGQIRFQTDSSSLTLRVKLVGLAGMNHMPATGQCGFDLYAGEPGREKFWNVTKYDHTKDSYEVVMFEKAKPELRCLTLNFPLYQGVSEVMVGLDPSARILPPPPRAVELPVVFYGTSITQGGCASRPGMAYTNILSRRLNLDSVNLGFSGNGRGEPEMARLMASLPASLYVLDYEANSVSVGLFHDSLPEFVKIIRGQRPGVPIMVVSMPRFARESFDADFAKARLECMEFQRDLVAESRRKGDKLVEFVDGAALLGSDDFDECTVDGVHPTDLGFLRMANALEPRVRAVLNLG